MNNINTYSAASSLSLEQWFLLFALAIGVMTAASFVTMISVWFVNSRLREISEKIDSKKD